MSLPFFLLLVVSSKPNIYPGRSKCLSLTIWQGSDHPNGKKCFPWSPPKEATRGKILLWMICEECVYIRNYARCSDIMITSQILRLRAYSLSWNVTERFLEEMTPRKTCKVQRESCGLPPSGTCGLQGYCSRRKELFPPRSTWFSWILWNPLFLVFTLPCWSVLLCLFCWPSFSF